MDTVSETTPKPKPAKKPLKPARKQVKAGEIERKETPQTGKEYSEYPHSTGPVHSD